MDHQSILLCFLILLRALFPIKGMCPSQCHCNDKSVHCSEGTLKNIPHFLNPNINTLNLANNDIVKLESGFTFYGELSIVNISRNSFHSLGRNQIMNQNKVTDLDISSNLESKIRKGAFNGLESLKTLNIIK